MNHNHDNIYWLYFNIDEIRIKLEIRFGKRAKLVIKQKKNSRQSGKIIKVRKFERRKEN